MSLEAINTLLGYGTLALQLLTAVLLALFLLRKKIPDLTPHAALVSTHAFKTAFLASALAAVVTLIHQYAFNLPPCEFCWWQRIALYPQILLFAFALRVKEVWMANYALALSIAGLLVALYHHMLQMAPFGALPCPSQGVSCTQIFFLEFGFITYPLMGATLFAFLIVLMLFARKN